MADRGLACTRLGIQAVTEAVADGSRHELARVWRCAEPLTEVATADRVRWQLEGWLTATAARLSGPAVAPAGPVVQLRLIPEEVVPAGDLQLGLWGQTGEGDERAGRALTRVQTLLGGPDTVLTAVLDGGRGPADRVRLVPWGEARIPLRDPGPPWPGRLPDPAPALLPAGPLPIRVLDATGMPVTVTDRCDLTGAPALVQLPGSGQRVREVISWAGPWPVAERWWDPDTARSVIRIQVVLTPTGHEPGGPQLGDGAVTGDGHAVLLLLHRGQWWVEGIYD